uniref:hypothetical protein n=1 Tax=Paenibacillus senegalimassiliensis TaxID=1737426 RepID=UPI00073EDE91
MTANAAETPTGAQTKVNAAVGNLASLQTTVKGNAVAAINELFTSASNGKTAVAAAITGKGVPALGSDTFGQLAGKIGQIVNREKYIQYGLTSATSKVVSINCGFAIGFYGLVIWRPDGGHHTTMFGLWTDKGGQQYTGTSLYAEGSFFTSEGVNILKIGLRGGYTYDIYAAGR